MITKEQQAKMKAGRDKAKQAMSAQKQCKTSRLSYELIQALEKVPDSCKALFNRVFNGGKSRADAVKAKCLECSCFDRGEITECAIKTCPLFSFRPYQKG